MSSPGLNPKQFRDYIVRPALAYLNLPNSEVNGPAERLLMGTSAHESLGFQYLHQLGSGPARGIFQMEPVTFNDLWQRYPADGPIGQKLRKIASSFPAPLHDQLMGNLYLACAMCRIHYYARPFQMPTSVKVEILAAIWKEHYNTYLGSGTTQEFIRHYNEWVAPLYPQ